MADQTSSLRVAVQVTGLEELNRLSNTFAQLRSETAARPSPVRPRASTETQERQAQTFGEQAGEAFGRNIVGPTLKAPFAIVQSAAGVASRSVISLAGPLAKLGVVSITGAATLGAAVVAIVAIAVPLFNLAATMKILRTSFGWAKEAADRQMTILARTKRTFPGLTGEALRAAETRTGAKLRVATAIFGDQAEAMQENITRRFTEARMGRGLRGERDIFYRWGITPQAVQTFEAARGGERIDLTDYLALFIRKREELDARQARTTEGSSEWRYLVQKRMQLADDSLKLFNQKFSTVILTWGTTDVARLRQGLQKAATLGAAGAGVDADQNARDFNIQLATTQTIFKQLRKGIAGDTQPALTEMMDSVRNYLTDTSEGGLGMGRAFRNLASSLAVHAWETIQVLIESIDPNEVNAFIREIKENWKPQDTVTKLGEAVPAIITMAEIIATLTKILFGAWGPEWLRRRVRGEGYFGRRKEVAAPGAAVGAAVGTAGPATFAERWGGAAPAAYRPGGGGGYMGGGGPGGGSAGGGPTYTGPTPQQVAAQRAIARAPGGRAPRYGTPEYQQWSQTPEYREWTQQAPEYQAWERQVQARPAQRLGPARFVRPGYAPPTPQPPPQAPAAAPVSGPSTNYRGREGSPTLAGKRAAIAQMYRNDPAAMDKLMGLVYAETGGQGEEAVLGKLESLGNRYLSRANKPGGPLPGTAGFTKAYYGKNPAYKNYRNDPKFQEQFNRAFGAFEGGSDISGLATGNWSGAPGGGTNKGVVTARLGTGGWRGGGEEFSTQGPDLGWARETRKEMLEKDPQLRAARATGEPEAVPPPPVQPGGGAFGGGGATGQLPAPTVTPAPAPPAAVTPERVGFRRGAEGAFVPIGAPEGRVDAGQGGKRRLPISNDLRAIFEYAAEKTGVQVKVISAGQLPASQLTPAQRRTQRTGSQRHDIGPGKLGAADIQLVMPDGTILDPKNAQHRPILAKFAEETVALGASGVGAEYGDMGRSIHIGGGPGPVKAYAPGTQNWLGNAFAAGRRRFLAGAPADVQRAGQEETAAEQRQQTQPAPGPQPPGTVRPGESLITDYSQQARLRTGGQMNKVEGMVIHHTSGGYESWRRRMGAEGGAAGVSSVLRKRGFSATFFIDKQGKIFRLTPEGKVAYHAAPTGTGWGGKALGRFTNYNVEGVEIEASDDKDVSEVQRAAAAQLVGHQAQIHGYDPKTRTFAHGELSGHKEKTEGWTATKEIREGRREAEIAQGRAAATGGPVVVAAQAQPPIEPSPPISELMEKQRRRRAAITAGPETERPTPAAEAKAAEEDTEAAKDLLKTKEAEKNREALTKKPPKKKDALEEGKAAGEAAAKSFKEGIKDTKIPIKSLKSEDTEREKKSEESEQKEAA